MVISINYNISRTLLPCVTIESLHVKYDAMFTILQLQSISVACGHRVIPEQSNAKLLMGLELLSAETLKNSAVQLHLFCMLL